MRLSRMSTNSRESRCLYRWIPLYASVCCDFSSSFQGVACKGRYRKLRINGSQVRVLHNPLTSINGSELTLISSRSLALYVPNQPFRKKTESRNSNQLEIHITEISVIPSPLAFQNLNPHSN